MEDAEILALYRARDERALAATEEKYRNYCMTVAANILDNEEDSAECVNDALLRAWNAIPPDQPQILSYYILAVRPEYFRGAAWDGLLN